MAFVSAFLNVEIMPLNVTAVNVLLLYMFILLHSCLGLNETTNLNKGSTKNDS